MTTVATITTNKTPRDPPMATSVMLSPFPPMSCADPLNLEQNGFFIVTVLNSIGMFITNFNNMINDNDCIFKSDDR